MNGGDRLRHLERQRDVRLRRIERLGSDLIVGRIEQSQSQILLRFGCFQFDCAGQSVTARIEAGVEPEFRRAVRGRTGESQLTVGQSETVFELRPGTQFVARVERTADVELPQRSL